MFRLPDCARDYRLRGAHLLCIPRSMVKNQAKPQPVLTRDFLYISWMSDAFSIAPDMSMIPPGLLSPAPNSEPLEF